MSVIGSEILAGASGNQGYNIQRSLRFRSSASAYLNRTPASAGNRKTWTWSGWVKRGALGGTTTDYTIFRAGTAATDSTDFSFSANGSGDVFYFRNRVASTNQFSVQTTQVFRDVSSWYHIVVALDTTQATASDRYKLYVNGVQVTSFTTATYGAQNSDSYVNAANVHYVGAATGPASYLDGYLAEVNFIDGQALTPSSFGQTDAVTGVWTPKKYTGTYGTNGFYLPFTDNTSATTLAYDKSGNGNNWTPNNISTTAGATYDSMTDVPTLTSATAANYCVMNPINSFVSGSSATFTNGNMSVSIPSVGSPPRNVTSTFAVSSGKYYWEFTAQSINSVLSFGVASTAMNFNAQISTTGLFGYQFDGQKNINGTISAYGASYTTGDVLGVALDMDAGTLVFYKNNTSQGTASSALSGLTVTPVMYASGSGAASGDFNFGQRPFSYTPPTGFKALNTFNLPDPTIKKGNQYMDAVTRTGFGSGGGSITSLNFQPDLLWDKTRNLGGSHILIDSVRGTSNWLSSDTTGAESTGHSTFVTSFNSNGYTMGAGDWTNSYTLVDWCWKESATAGFDIVTYTGTGSNTTVAHSLGVAPKMIIVKNRDNGTEPWFVYHASANASPATGAVFLNQTTAFTTGATYWNNTAPTASVFSVGTNTGTNQNTSKMLAYLFAEIAGFSKFGSYTGNGSANGPFVYCGFRPKYVMIKTATSLAEDWYLIDTSRSPYNETASNLFADLASAQDATYNHIDILSNGFKMRSANGGTNYSGATLIYACFAENPFKYSNAR